MTFCCEECNRSFKTKSSLKTHAVVHGQANRKCNVCSFSTKHSSNLQRHKLIHKIGDARFIVKCPVCENGFRESKLLKHHMMSKHDHEKEFKCLECEKQFSYRINFINHVAAIHQPDKPFMCTYENCPFKTAVESRLKTHIKQKHVIKEYKCFLCEKVLKSATGMKYHLMTHTQEKPFKCSEPNCSYATSHSADLTTHTRTHTGNKPYKCLVENCCYASSHNNNLTIHTRIHTGERPYKCSEASCSYAGKRSRDIKNHMKIHSK